MAVSPDRVLILTPVKDAEHHLPSHDANLRRLTYPREAIHLAFLESDSADGTWGALQERCAVWRELFPKVRAYKKDFGFRLPPGVPRWEPSMQPARRAILARSRNHLLLRGLEDEEWVLWMDVDLASFPGDVIERLIAAGRDVVVPHCVLAPGGPTFDTNSWRDRGRVHLDALRGQGEVVPLDAVGGSMLLVRADRHRDGLVFPCWPYGEASARCRPEAAELETEGLGLLAHDMGVGAFGMPDLEVVHKRA